MAPAGAEDAPEVEGALQQAGEDDDGMAQAEDHADSGGEGAAPAEEGEGDAEPADADAVAIDSVVANGAAVDGAACAADDPSEEECASPAAPEADAPDAAEEIAASSDDEPPLTSDPLIAEMERKIRERRSTLRRTPASDAGQHGAARAEGAHSVRFASRAAAQRSKTKTWLRGIVSATPRTAALAVGRTVGFGKVRGGVVARVDSRVKEKAAVYGLAQAAAAIDMESLATHARLNDPQTTEFALRGHGAFMAARADEQTELLRSLVRNRHVARIDLGHCALGDAAAYALAEVIASSAVVRSLDISHHRISTRALCKLLGAVPATSSLAELHLCSMQAPLEPAALRALLETARRAPITRAVVGAAADFIGDAERASLCDAIGAECKANAASGRRAAQDGDAPTSGGEAPLDGANTPGLIAGRADRPRSWHTFDGAPLVRPASPAVCIKRKQMRTELPSDWPEEAFGTVGPIADADGEGEVIVVEPPRDSDAGPLQAVRRLSSTLSSGIGSLGELVGASPAKTGPAAAATPLTEQVNALLASFCRCMGLRQRAAAAPMATGTRTPLPTTSTGAVDESAWRRTWTAACWPAHEHY